MKNGLLIYSARPRFLANDADQLGAGEAALGQQHHVGHGGQLVIAERRLVLLPQRSPRPALLECGQQGGIVQPIGTVLAHQIYRGRGGRLNGCGRMLAHRCLNQVGVALAGVGHQRLVRRLPVGRWAVGQMGHRRLHQPLSLSRRWLQANAGSGRTASSRGSTGSKRFPIPWPETLSQPWWWPRRRLL